MADTTMQQITGFMPEMQDITRQREMAKMLMQQSQQPLQGQMVGNTYVGASPWQGIANLYSAYKGNQLAKEADVKQNQLAELIRKGTAEDLMKYNELMYGKQGTADVVPEGQTLRDDQGNLTYGAQQGVANVAPNPKAAYEFALQSRFPTVSGQAMEMLKGQKLGAEETLQRFNPQTGKMEIIGQGVNKFHEPLKIDTGTGTQIIDPKTMQVLSFVPKAKGGLEDLQHLGGVRGQFISEVKPHVEIADAYSKVVSAPKTAAGDMSKIYGYMKILDPGSTVREGEYATAQNAAGVTEKARNLYNRVLNGEKLTDTQRNEFDQASGALVQSQKDRYKRIESHYTNIANKAGIQPELIISNPYEGLNVKTAQPPVLPPTQTQGTGRYNPLKPTMPAGAAQVIDFNQLPK